MDRSERRHRQRVVYPTLKQKKRLVELIVKQPQLNNFKVTSSFNHSDSQKLWNNIATECNSLPGARKTWRQWRKTWQDIKAHAKKNADGVPSLVRMLSPAEQEALGFKDVPPPTKFQRTTEFVGLEDQTMQEIVDDTNTNGNSFLPKDDYTGDDYLVTLSEPGSPPDVKVFTERITRTKKTPMRKARRSRSNSCSFNTDMLTAMEQKKIQIKEDYFNFKKDYLKQKLVLMKEQAEALKRIAQELSK